jgi:predicted ATP-dependent protease
MIPYQNIANLTLNGEVLAAITAGRFHIYPVKTIDEGIELLTGASAGEMLPDGNYPPATVNYLVSQKLRQYAETLVTFGKDAETNKTGGNELR